MSANATDALDGGGNAVPVVELVASITRALGACIVVFGGLLVEGGSWPVLPVDYATVLAAGAVVLAGSTVFDVHALRGRLDDGA